jgi:predicted amidohydrolase YtcJ
LKSRTIAIALVLAVAAVIVVLLLTFSRRHVSVLVINGSIHTMDESRPRAQALAVEADRIVAVGETAELLNRYTADTTIDLGGGTVFPGFIDSHAHMEGLGIALKTLNLAGTTSLQEIQRRVRAEAAQRADTSWIRGRGWDQTKWSEQDFPSHEVLDSVSAAIPIMLMRIDGHAAWVNRRVLQLTGISKDTPDPPGGKILRSKDGSPTGVFLDNAMDTLRAVMPAISRKERMDALRLASAECVRVGLTEVHDMGVDLEQIDIYKQMLREGTLPIRIYAAIDGPGNTWEHYKKSGPEVGLYGGFLSVRALKLYADGALGSRGAALIQPYSDDPTNRGVTTTSSEKLSEEVESALQTGFQVCIHAIGDRANNIVLDVYEKALTDSNTKHKDIRFRVEHAQILALSDISRFSRIGIIPAMQPTHCTSDMYWAENRLGPERARGAYAWRSLIDAGSIIPAGSDFPVESPNPLLGIYAAITRQDLDGWPPQGWHAGERMTRLEAVKGYTVWGAFAGFQEHDKGMLRAGMWADFVVLTKDLMMVEPSEIPNARVLMTVVGGRVAYSYTNETDQDSVSGKSHHR